MRAEVRESVEVSDQWYCSKGIDRRSETDCNSSRLLRMREVRLKADGSRGGGLCVMLDTIYRSRFGCQRGETRASAM